MKKVTKKKIKEFVGPKDGPFVEVNKPVKPQLGLLEANFPNEEMNRLVDKINEIIAHVNRVL